ncbi:MAG: hypothetical protein KJO59_03250, partial [Ignavibacteria bacterium]|nr:hypothetical protein [Ignavibacteria bacterium]
QSESDIRTEQTIKTNQTFETNQSSTNNQSTLSTSEEVKHECNAESKEECKRICEEKKNAGSNMSSDGMDTKECKPDCKMECCANDTEETLETEESSGKG